MRQMYFKSLLISSLLMVAINAKAATNRLLSASVTTNVINILSTNNVKGMLNNTQFNTGSTPISLTNLPLTSITWSGTNGVTTNTFLVIIPNSKTNKMVFTNGVLMEIVAYP